MTQMKRTLISLGKAKKTTLLAVSFLIALVVILSHFKTDKSEAQTPKPSQADQKASQPGQKPGQAPGGGAPQLPPPLVRMDVVGMLDHTQPVPKVGTVTAKETVQIVPRVSGYLMNVAFKEGDFVKEGDLLFEIEDTVYNINVTIAQSVIQQIEAEVALAKLNRDRVERLVEKEVSRQQELDDAMRTLSLHEGRLKEAQARLEQAENDLSYTKIYAPLNGRIGAKQFSVGNYLTPASGVLATIMQFDPITVNFPVTEREFSTYFHDAGEKKEAKIELLLADGTPFEEEFYIDFYDNYVDRFTGQLMVYLLCKNESGKLFPGGFTKVNLSEKFEQPKPAVNVAALLTDGATHFVYVVQKSQKESVDEKGNPVVDEKGDKVLVDAFNAERRTVTLGPQVLDQRMITSGLMPGEMVVIGGQNKIMAPNQPITPVPTPALMQMMQAMQAQATQAGQEPPVTQEEVTETPEDQQTESVEK